MSEDHNHDPHHDLDAATAQVPLQRLLETVRQATGDPSLEPDADSHIALCCGSAEIYVWLMADSTHVRMLSPLLAKVPSSAALLARLNELNQNGPLLRLAVHGTTVCLMAELMAEPYVAEHVANTLVAFCAVAARLVDELQAEFRGLNAVNGEMPSVH